MSKKNEYEKHINQLGLRVKDKVTGYTGVITSISFDLYGCVQAVVTAEIGEDGKHTSGWYDVTRLVIVDGGSRAMPLPNFAKGYVAKGRKGAANKPSFKCHTASL